MTPRGLGAARPSLARSVSQEEEKARRAKLAQERRAKVMAQMSALQKVFIKENAQLLASMEAEEYDLILLTFSPHNQLYRHERPFFLVFFQISSLLVV